MIMLHHILALWLMRFGNRGIIPYLLLLLCLVFAWYKQEFAGAFFGAIERAGARFAERFGIRKTARIPALFA
jgi:hypothetical protein